MKYWDNSGFLARIEDKGITVLLEWDAYLALDICETLNESNKFFLYSRNTGKVWLVDSKREVIDELDLRCSNLRHMLVDNKMKIFYMSCINRMEVARCIISR